ncbi:MAG: hypothetical protein JWN30_656 [Bacilli bacterium]|nr:hypothetical protein [Bacilli bacterium]
MSQTIDRFALVTRHNPVIREVMPLSPLSVGNGEFAFTADLTGLQSFPESYEFPLGTQSQWGWHYSNASEAYTLDDLQLQYLDSHERKVGYPIDPKGQEEPFHWSRQNPHRLQLAQIGLRLFSSNQELIQIGDLRETEQMLDLWSGQLTSRFQVNGIPVKVQTCCHPTSDQLGVCVESPLLETGLLEITFRFPSPTMPSANWSETMHLNWAADDSHQTRLLLESSQSGAFTRTMDQDGYQVVVAWSGGEMIQESSHFFRLVPTRTNRRFEFVAGFAPIEQSLPLSSFQAIQKASKVHWEKYWMQGGAIELAESHDTRALELERRIVLSQYLTAIHCAGSLPPQETGLLYNSWFGKFHLEMHWWHAAHFALWGRTHLLQKSMGWYKEILPVAKQLAQSQGYKGARWPKMVGPDGVQSPSNVGTLLIWQQPHPLMFAELCYRSDPTQETLEYFRDIVMETAEFMASFAAWDDTKNRYVLGPPLIPAQESHKALQTVNPTYELEYWRHGLEIGLAWRKRLGLQTVPEWEHVMGNLSDLPVSGEVYLAHEKCPDTFTSFNKDHPSMLGALGILPGVKVDREVMRQTLQKVMTNWKWETAWGWDFPMAAMTAARLGEGGLAVDLLLLNATKNTYLPSGHNYQRPNLLAYLPGNGGLLAAVAMMACGWEGGPRLHAPGFPTDGTWTIRWEGLNAWL